MNEKNSIDKQLDTKVLSILHTNYVIDFPFCLPLLHVLYD